MAMRLKRCIRRVRRLLIIAAIIAAINTALKRRQQGGTDFGPSGSGGAGVRAPTGGPTPQPSLAMAAAVPTGAATADATATTRLGTLGGPAARQPAPTDASVAATGDTPERPAALPETAPAAPPAEPASGARTEAGSPPPAAWVVHEDDTAPQGYPVKANIDSGIFHVPGGLSYERTHADRWYRSAEAAEADGLRKAKR